MKRRLDSDQLMALQVESEPPPKDETDPLIAALLNKRYRVMKRIATGTQANIYLARHTLIKRQVIIKVLHPEMSIEPELVRRFLDEAQIVGTMGHPNIVESIDMGVTDDNRPYIVLEYLEGETLTHAFAKRVFDLDRTAHVAMQMASALDAVHKRGIVHRDLKPENVVLVTDNARVDIVKLIDFGISKVSAASHLAKGAKGEKRREQHSRPEIFLGTPEFMAPEQITDSSSVDARADIYALGVMMYEMLCGKTPFEGEGFPEILESIVNVEPKPLGERRAGLPKEFLAIVNKCLKKKRDERYQKMSEVEEALRPFAKEPPLNTKASRIETKKKGPSSSPSSSTPPSSNAPDTEKDEKPPVFSSIPPAKGPSKAPPPKKKSRKAKDEEDEEIIAARPASRAREQDEDSGARRKNQLILAGVVVAAIVGIALLLPHLRNDTPTPPVTPDPPTTPSVLPSMSSTNVMEEPLRKKVVTTAVAPEESAAPPGSASASASASASVAPPKPTARWTWPPPQRATPTRTATTTATTATTPPVEPAPTPPPDKTAVPTDPPIEPAPPPTPP